MQSKPNIVLASASPRRRELLKLLQLDFEVLSCPIAETARLDESPQEMVQRLARAKAEAAQSLRPQSIVVGADTVVVCDHQMFGKPRSNKAAQIMLSKLSGRVHQVLTGVCVLHGQKCELALSETLVQFSSLSSHEIEAYLKTGEPFDKAGAYAIQGFGARFIERIDGCYFNVVGLPISLLYQMLKRIGCSFNEK
jgi:septum formation protein